MKASDGRRSERKLSSCDKGGERKKTNGNGER